MRAESVCSSVGLGWPAILWFGRIDGTAGRQPPICFVGYVGMLPRAHGRVRTGVDRTALCSSESMPTVYAYILP